MEDFVNKFIQFILFLVNAIKDMVAVLAGRKPYEEPTTAAPADEGAEG